MNDTVIDTRALDAWLAEHLFRSIVGHGVVEVRILDGGAPPFPRVPAYSTTGDGMLLVAREIERRGWYWKIGTDMNQAGTYVWASVWHEDHDPDLIALGEAQGNSDVAPMALARAARAALVGEQERALHE